MRRSWAAREVSFVLLATWAIWISACRSAWLPLRVLPLRRLPPRSALPGHMPAHEARCRASEERRRAAPTSARGTAAARAEARHRVEQLDRRQGLPQAAGTAGAHPPRGLVPL